MYIIFEFFLEFILYKISKSEVLYTYVIYLPFVPSGSTSSVKEETPAALGAPPNTPAETGLASPEIGSTVSQALPHSQPEGEISPISDKLIFGLEDCEPQYNQMWDSYDELLIAPENEGNVFENTECLSGALRPGSGDPEPSFSGDLSAPMESARTTAEGGESEDESGSESGDLYNGSKSIRYRDFKRLSPTSQMKYLTEDTIPNLDERAPENPDKYDTTGERLKGSPCLTPGKTSLKKASFYGKAKTKLLATLTAEAAGPGSSDHEPNTQEVMADLEVDRLPESPSADTPGEYTLVFNLD